jgi:hypothetical protein
MLGTADIASLMKPWFYQDNAHTLLVQPTVAERTIEEWQEWVTQTPQPDSETQRPQWWKDIVVTPQVPLANGAVLVGPSRDWLANSRTGLLFDGEVIGPVGRAGLEVGTPTEVAAAIAAGGLPVNLHAGSGLASGSVVIETAGDPLEKRGLTQAGGGLKVVGSGGLIGRHAPEGRS